MGIDDYYRSLGPLAGPIVKWREGLQGRVNPSGGIHARTAEQFCAREYLRTAKRSACPGLPMLYIWAMLGEALVAPDWVADSANVGGGWGTMEMIRPRL